MTKKNRQLTLTMGLIGIFVLIDLLFKFWISSRMDHGDYVPLAGEVFFLTNVYNTRIAGFASTIDWLGIIDTILKILFSTLFLVILLRDASYRFKVSAAMILFGWIGIFLDRILLAHGTQGYLSMEYFHDNLITGSTISISFLLITTGWLIFVISVFTRFNEFRRIFVRSRENADRASGK